MFAQRRNRLMTHFSERIPIVKRRISVQIFLSCRILCCVVWYERNDVSGKPTASIITEMESFDYLPWITAAAGSYETPRHFKGHNPECRSVYAFFWNKVDSLLVQTSQCRFIQQHSGILFISSRQKIKRSVIERTK